MSTSNIKCDESIASITLKGDYCKLIPLDLILHADDLFMATALNENHNWIWSHLPYGPFVNVEDMKSTLVTLTAKDDQRCFAVQDIEQTKLVGMISILHISEQNRKAEIGDLWFSPEVHKTPINTEANFLVLKHLFDTHQYQRAEWKCNAANKKSCHAAERLGYSLEGVFRNWRYMKGAFRDVCWYGMLQEEWNLLKTNYEIWLNDPSGVSLRELNIDTIESLN